VKTGGGIGDTENIDEDEMGEQLWFYMPADGPDDHTSEEARNLWEQITKEFEFFPALHALMATWPNVTPISITTGVGPQGAEMILFQELSDDEEDG
ncbi:hypothetical protein K439DRAFT_1364479, partial [Ramaria rubella]